MDSEGGPLPDCKTLPVPKDSNDGGGDKATASTYSSEMHLLRSELQMWDLVNYRM